MNKERRKRLSNVIEQLEILRDEVNDVCSEEDDAFENLPEGIQDSERGETMQTAIEALESAADWFEEVIHSVQEAIDV